MIASKAPEEAWKKKFRLPRERFVELAEELRPIFHQIPYREIIAHYLLRRNLQ